MDFFEFDLENGEPFLRLPSPYDKIILTRPRFEYAEAMAEILNDSSVYPFINAPYPHTKEDAQRFIRQIREVVDKTWSEINSTDKGSHQIFSGVPVRSICEIQSNGKWMYLGDFGFTRRQAKDIETRTQENRINHERPEGDREIEWSVGCRSNMKSMAFRMLSRTQIT